MTSVLPTANPTTGKTHVAEVTKYHEGGTLKPYSHEEAVGPKGTSVDVSSSFRYCNVLYCLITSSLLFVFVSSVARRERERERETLINKSIINSVPQKINKATSKRRSMGGSMDGIHLFSSPLSSSFYLYPLSLSLSSPISETLNTKYYNFISHFFDNIQ